MCLRLTTLRTKSDGCKIASRPELACHATQFEKLQRRRAAMGRGLVIQDRFDNGYRLPCVLEAVRFRKQAESALARARYIHLSRSQQYSDVIGMQALRQLKSDTTPLEVNIH